jgi:CheY-like chemotaxis protein
MDKFQHPTADQQGDRSSQRKVINMVGLKKQRSLALAIFPLWYSWMMTGGVGAADGEGVDDETINQIIKQRLKLLLIDDEDGFRTAMAFHLEEVYGCRVKEVAQGLEAVREYEAGNTYDLVFLDLMMHPMNGVETFRQLKQLDGDCPIVMMSAHTAGREWQEAEQLGAELIAKPMSEKTLARILSSCKKKGPK